MTQVRRRRPVGMVQWVRAARAWHVEFTPEEWDRVLNGRWLEVIDEQAGVTYRCSSDVARREGATLRRAGAEVRWLYVGVMQRHQLRRSQ
jgi:hypothetical protein